MGVGGGTFEPPVTLRDVALVTQVPFLPWSGGQVSTHVLHSSPHLSPQAQFLLSGLKAGPAAGGKVPAPCTPGYKLLV